MHPKKNMKLLTIDDDVSVRNSIRDFLEDLEYEVVEAENGLQGIECFEREQPDLILVDIRMPVMDGLQVLEQMKEISPDTPIIVISGTTGVKDVVEALRLGAWDYLIKPILEMRVLQHSVEKALERANLLIANKRTQEYLHQEIETRTEELQLHKDHLEEMIEERTRSLSHEITERKLAEARLEDIAKSSSDWFWETNEQLRFTYASRRFYQISQYGPNDVIGKTRVEMVNDMNHTSSDEKQIENENDMLKHEAFRGHEYELILKDGSTKIIQVSGTPVFDLNNKFTGYRGSGTDVTELRNAQNHLQESEKLAALGRLVAGVAHEINTPLGVCMTSSTLQKEQAEKISNSLKDKTLSEGGLQSFLELSISTSRLFESNIKRASDLIQSFKQIAVSQSHYEIEDFNLRSHIESTIFSISPSLIKKDIKFKVNIDENLAIDSYPGLYSQILINLINNSYLYGFEGIDDCEINISANVEKSILNMDYKDNGVGLSKEVQSHIFEPFFTTGRIKGGTGLGMSILYNIITSQLDGQLKILSTADKQGFHLSMKIPV